MSDLMTFPKTWEEFERSYGFTDKDEVYTNGARLIPSFRAEQWLEHIESQTVDAEPTEEQVKEYCRKRRLVIVDSELFKEMKTRWGEEKHGHWIEREVGLICSECGHYTEAMYDEPFNNEFGKGWALKRPYYCGYCGAKMEVEDV